VSLSRILADIAGLLSLALLSGLCFAVYPGLDAVRSHWMFCGGAYVLLAIGGYRMWRNDVGRTEMPWPQIVLISIGVGAASFVIDIAIGRLTHSDLPTFEGAAHVSGPMGFGLTLIMCPGVTCVGLSGWCRNIVLRYAGR